MTLPARASISAFPRGHEFDTALFSLTERDVRSYVEAVGDTNVYGDTVPPLAAVALGLGALQEQIRLPEGSLHTGQEVEQEATVRAGEALTLTGRIAQRSERQGFIISVIDFEIATGARVAIRARTTIMVPGGAA